MAGTLTVNFTGIGSIQCIQGRQKKAHWSSPKGMFRSSVVFADTSKDPKCRPALLNKGMGRLNVMDVVGLYVYAGNSDNGQVL